MKQFIIILSIALMLTFLSASFAQSLPAGHPTLPTLPSGHPPVGDPPEPAEAPDDWAEGDDVSSIDAIVSAYYESVSGGKGVARNWDRFRSLFMPGARLMTLRRGEDRDVPVVITIDEFIASNSTYFTNGGYFETEIHRTSETFGEIASVFSTYASRRLSKDARPYSRGINSFQLINDGERWWIVDVMWAREKPATEPLPTRYLPAGAP